MSLTFMTEMGGQTQLPRALYAADVSEVIDGGQMKAAGRVLSLLSPPKHSV